ncbi:MAG TPA: hypothetical protein PLD35_04190 [Caldisericia bacterium]|nr:hypothetical protein [Caldisericia bacterium]
MKRIVSIIVMFILFFISFTYSLPQVKNSLVSAETPSLTVAIEHLYKVGFNYDGTPLKSGILFPWQSTKESLWGKENYPMTEIINGEELNPVFYTTFYLNLIPNGGKSKGFNKYYIVIDNKSNLWFDKDGKFNNPLYDGSRDPKNPHFVNGSCNNANILDGRVRYSFDPSSDNNTLGPYKLSELSNENYLVSEIEGRKFILALLDMTDYYALSKLEDDDWDLSFPLINFNAQEMHADNISANGSFDPSEWIYRKGGVNSDAKVEVGDIRLSPVLIESFVYEPNTIVKQYDKDIGLTLINFKDVEKHTENVDLNSLYDYSKKFDYEYFNEFIYLDSNNDFLTSLGEVRLTPVNCKVDKNTFNLINLGLTENDGIILAEIPETGLSRDYAIQTNYTSFDSIKNLSALLSSSNKDIPLTTVSLSHGTLVEGDEFSSVAFIQNVKPTYFGFLGLEIFNDNGINNKITSLDYETPLYHDNLSDDYKENGSCEEIIGIKSGSPDLDYKLPLSDFSTDIKFYDSSGTGFGVNEPLYRDNDLSNTVSSGDERLLNVTLNMGENDITYDSKTFVVDGDADVGLTLNNILPYFKYVDLNPLDQELSENQKYDADEPIYRKHDPSSLNNYVSANDMRIVKVKLPQITYDEGTPVKPPLFLYNQSNIKGLTMGKSGDFRCIDIPLSLGPIVDLDLTTDGELKVEKTTTFTLSMPPLMNGERLFIFVDEPLKRETTERALLLKKEIKYPFSGVLNFTITPYRSSLTEEGANPLSVILFFDIGGFHLEPLNYYDKTLSSYFYEEIRDLRKLKYEELLPKDFTASCFDIREFIVEPEDAIIKTNKECLSTLDVRYPNLWGKLIDADNPKDINDPSIEISGTNADLLIANYNASGAGIRYLFTAYSSSPIYGFKRYIVQINDNNYCFWEWNDRMPLGVLDPNDELSFEPIYIYEMPTFKNNDCSKVIYLSSIDKIGVNLITQNDFIGIFDGETHSINYKGVDYTIDNAKVEKFGVDVRVESYGSMNESDIGGDFPLCIAPQNEGDKVLLRIYLKNGIYDYNSSIVHPPYFIESAIAINYLGFKEFKTQTLTDINFTNLAIVDHALEYSTVNYTYGEDALSPLSFPRISSPYDPLVKDFDKDFVAYPGGEAHTGRSMFGGRGGRARRSASSFGYNAYPSAFYYLNNYSSFVKLGTEFLPLTDYSFYFTLQTKTGEYLRFGDDAPVNLRVEKIVVSGPFKTPALLDVERGIVVSQAGNPLSFDYSGNLIIDRVNARWFQTVGEDWSNSIGFGPNIIMFEDEDINPYLRRTKILNYSGLSYVFKIPEIIPTEGGELHVKVYCADGTVVELGDCCKEEPTIGLKVHGLRVENMPETLELFENYHLAPTLIEFEPYQEVSRCNNAFVYIWQDRGIRMYADQLLNPIDMGAGDGRVNMQTGEWSDLNLDGKISFADYETEIIGTYDLASNTWEGGIYDARTFNVDNGVYPLTLDEASNTQLTQYGADFSSRIGDSYGRRSDHIISEEEVCPIYINAYKYEDDNNDRAFTPLYMGRSHEVYMAGEKRIVIKPKEDLIVDYYPAPLTAGCIPELVDPTAPLTFTVMDSGGRYLDLKYGVADAQGNSYVEDDDLWQHLFKDDVTEPLPQYYWLRTDLHNVDNTFACNEKMYSKLNNSFKPITVDFKRSFEGKYIFKNFCANDSGRFEVTVFTPDHIHSGRVMVEVTNPKVEYNVSSVSIGEGRGPNEGPQIMFDAGGIDLIMTGGVNKLYRVSVKSFNAQGVLIKGVDVKSPFVKGGEREEILHSGRLTPYTTKPASFDLSLKFKNVLNPYFIHLGIIKDEERFLPSKDDISEIGGFGIAKNIFYNTTNVQYESGLFSKEGVIVPNTGTNLNDGWGYGAIYNNPRSGVYMFPDVNKDSKLTSEDSFTLGPDGTAQFLIFAEDLCNVGVLVSGNYFTDSDVFGDLAGKPPHFRDDPLTVRGRFSFKEPLSDGIFALDWDAFPDNELKISSPVISIKEAETKNPFRRDLLNPANYDLKYGIISSIEIEVSPADQRDLPVQSGFIQLQGNNGEAFSYGSILREGGKSKTVISFTPTGIGEGVASLLLASQNKYKDNAPFFLQNPSNYMIDLNTSFDVVKALKIIISPEIDIKAGIDNELPIKIVEEGTRKPLQGIKVSISSGSFSIDSITDELGYVYFNIKPNLGDKIRIYTYSENYIENEIFLEVSK